MGATVATRDKSNKKFMLLSAIGIFMVVDHHTFTAFNLLGDYLPYNSFFMPMFVFISGYFNKVDKTTDLWKYLVKKVKTLLLPYIGLSLFVFAVQQLINYIKLGNEMAALPSDYFSFVLKRIVTTGTFGAIVEPMWFVIALFSTLMVYAVLKKFLHKIKAWNSFVMLAVFIALHIYVVWLTKNTDAEALHNWLVPLKCCFFFPFIELGVIYRNYLEKPHAAMPAGGKIGFLFVLLALNAIRTAYMPAAYDIAFDSIDELAGFTSPYLVTPIVSSLIGILFWLTAVDLVAKPVGESRFVNYMSCNTFWIMGLHIISFNIFNCILMGINGIVRIPEFDVETFRETEWYYWGISGNIKILYVIAGILIPLGIKFLFDRIRAWIIGKIENMAADSPTKKKRLSVIASIASATVFVLAVSLVFVLTRPKETKDPYDPEQFAAIDTEEQEEEDEQEYFDLNGDEDADQDPDEDADDQGDEEPAGDPEEEALTDENGDADTDDEEPTDENGDEDATDEERSEASGEEDPAVADTQAGSENQETKVQSPEKETTPETKKTEAAKPDHKNTYPVNAYLDLAYDGGDYLSGPYSIYGNEGYKVTIRRSDSAEAAEAFDSLSYMGIRILEDEVADVDIAEAEIKNIKVVCDGVALKLDVGNGTVTMDGGAIACFFDCYGPDGQLYDFSGKNEIVITFTMKGTKSRK